MHQSKRFASPTFLFLLAFVVIACDDASSDNTAQDTTQQNTSPDTFENTDTNPQPDTFETTDTQQNTSSDTQIATDPDTFVDLDTTITSQDAPEDTADTNLPPAPLLAEYALEDAQAYPEAVTFDPVERAFYTGSLATGTITKTEADGQQSEFFSGNTSGEWLVLGVEVDPTRRRLWACAALGKDLSASEVWLFDLESGERIWQSSFEGVHVGAACSDMVITSDGTAYACDREAGNIYRLNADTQNIEIFATNPLLDPEIIGQNGIALSADTRFLLVVKFLPARLMRISIENPNSIEEVLLVNETSQQFASGADAVVVLNGNAYIAFDSDLVRVVPEDERWVSGQVAFHSYTRPTGALMGGVSGLTAAEGALYASKSDVVRFAVGLPPQLPFLIERVDPSVFDSAP